MSQKAKGTLCQGALTLLKGATSSPPALRFCAAGPKTHSNSIWAQIDMEYGKLFGHPDTFKVLPTEVAWRQSSRSLGKRINDQPSATEKVGHTKRVHI